MTWGWVHLKAKGSIPSGLSELPVHRSCPAPECELAHDSIVPQEGPLRCKALGRFPLPGHPRLQSGFSVCPDFQHEALAGQEVGF